MHPLQKKGESVEQAIRREREWMQPVRDHADFVLDTSALSIAKLRSELLDLFGQQGDRGGLAVNILSFGFKHGIPIEADLVFDVRFMPNPYYVPELKNKTGLDQAVRDFVFSFRQTNDFMEQLEKMLTFLLPLYAEEGKSALVIAIGCTGGHHRSVAVAHELAEYITEEGYQVTVANDGEEGLEKFNQVKPDMVLLDVMMPKMDGLEVCRRIRKAGNTPVMMLTAKGETFDKVLGLELGADDYMVKPFDAKEVVARIKAVLRRCQTTTAAAESTEGVIEFDNLRLDYTRDQLLDEVWGFEYYGDSRTIDVHVKRLREKLAGASDKWELKTVWGVGYKFEVRQ